LKTVYVVTAVRLATAVTDLPISGTDSSYIASGAVLQSATPEKETGQIR